MSNIRVQQVDGSDQTMPQVLEEFEKRQDEVRRRAHELFLIRNSGVGLELEDWLAAEREIFGWAKTELVKKGNALEILVTLPGFDSPDVEVTAAPGQIVVYAQASQDGVWSSEVYRRFDLPESVAVDKVVAKLDKGILHITAPCAIEAKPPATVKQLSVAAA